MISEPEDIELGVHDDFTIEQLDIDETLIPGDWVFKGYYPPHCRETPDCFVSRLGLNLDLRKERKAGFDCYQT